MKTLIYRIYLLEPALVTALEGDPNSAVAFDYLPGSVLRGALIERLLRRERSIHPDFELDAADSGTRRIFFEPATRYLNGYIANENQRSLPILRSLHVQKRTQTPIKDFARLTDDEIKKLTDPPRGDKIIWQSQSGFGFMQGEKVYHPKIERQITVHIQRPDRRAGRPRGGENGTVYQYEALAAGQTFEAAVLCDDDADADWLAELLTEMPEGWIGGARSAGYGRVQFEVVDSVEGTWREANTPDPTDGSLILTLLSDAILRDANGSYAPDLPSARAAIAARLGLSSPETLGKGKAYLSTTQIGGFNRKWGLPLPQTAALAMGSVLIFKHPGCDEETLRRLEWEGIGERRAEGFGRVGINLSTRDTYAYEPVKEQLITQEQLPELPVFLANRLIEQEMERLLTAHANQINIASPPRPNQINSLRLAIAQQGLGGLRAALASIDKRQVARTQFQKARIDRKPLDRWLAETVGDIEDGDWFAQLGIPKPKFASEQPSSDFRAYYTLRLIDAVLARAAKQAKEDR